MLASDLKSVLISNIQWIVNEKEEEVDLYNWQDSCGALQLVQHSHIGTSYMKEKVNLNYIIIRMRCINIVSNNAT